MDAGARRPSSARLRPRLCDLRPRRLARAHRNMHGLASQKDPPHARVFGSPHTLLQRKGRRGKRATNVLRRRGLMRAFSELYEELDTTTSTNLKVAAMARYFATARPADAAWAVYI